MISLLIIWLYKSYLKNHSGASLKKFRKLAPLVLLFLLFSLCLTAQDRVLNYDILHKDEIVGHLIMYQTIDGKRLHIKSESQVKARFIITVIVKTTEEAIYENGVLVYSSLHRSVNGNERLNRSLQLTDVGYQAKFSDAAATIPSAPIRFSILLLYYQEPVNIASVYSDNYQQYVGIKNIGNSTYYLELPNGNFNKYFYSNGVCTQVEVNQFYNLDLRLKH